MTIEPLRCVTPHAEQDLMRDVLVSDEQQTWTESSTPQLQMPRWSGVASLVEHALAVIDATAANDDATTISSHPADQDGAEGATTGHVHRTPSMTSRNTEWNTERKPVASMLVTSERPTDRPQINNVSTGHDDAESATDDGSPAAQFTDSSTAVTEPTGADRRGHARHNGICLVTVVPTEEDEAIDQCQLPWLLQQARLQGHMIDVSQSGVAFVGPEDLVPETPVLIRMSNYRLGTKLDTSGRILRCTEEDDLFRVVCTFDYNLSEEQVSTLSKQIFDGSLV